MAIKVQAKFMEKNKTTVFAVAFRMHKKQDFMLLDSESEETPDIVIVDLDIPGVLELTEQYAKTHPSIPVLAITLQDSLSVPYTVLKKPIRVESFFPALHSALNPPQKMASAPDTRTEKEPVAPSKSAPTTPPPSKFAKSADVPKVFTLKSYETFKASQGLLGTALTVYRDSMDVVVKRAGAPETVILLKSKDRVITDLSVSQWREWSNAGDITVTPFSENTARIENGKTFRWDAFLWMMTKLSAKGRLLDSITPHTVISLKKWPNLTRVPATVQDIRLSAFLARTPASPTLIIKLMQVSQEEVFDYLAAMDSLGCLKYVRSTSNNSGKVEVTPSPTDTVIPETISSDGERKRGFLSRILSKITGEDA